MADSSITPDLEGLLGLAASTGIDVRPTLLRVLTDLFVQRRIRTTDAARQYIQITLRLLDSANLESRKAVAAKLATDPMAPHRIIERLARDEIAVAEPILKHSTCLSFDDLAAIATAKGGAHAEIIAARDPAPTETPPVTISAGDNSAELAESFFSAGSAERRLILMSLDYASLPDDTVQQTSDVTRRLETAALKADAAGAARELERALGLTSRLARRIVEDASGEPLVAAAKAIGCPTPVLQRILLFVNPAIGHSVDRVYELSQLYNEISTQAARQLVAIWRDADPAERPQPRHAPLFASEPASTGRRETALVRPAAQSIPRRAVLER